MNCDFGFGESSVRIVMREYKYKTKEMKMAVLHPQKYKCPNCNSTFVVTEGCIQTTNMICQECGAKLEYDQTDFSDSVNPFERIKSVRHTVKSIYSAIFEK